jgi:GT2 family glycosyltransferase
MAEIAPSPRVTVVILNWRRPDDTIACAASVMALDHAALDVIVCDNDSGDGSLDRIEAELRARMPAINAARAGRGRAGFAPIRREPGASALPGEGPRLWLVQTGRNGGYAAGNNVGIRLALGDPDTAFVWVLNNDTVVAPDALTRLLERMAEDPRIGLCGAVVRYLGRENEVQSLGGGRFLPMRARCEQLGEGADAGTSIDIAATEAALSYVNGAAVLARRSFLEQVGLMDEGYFLYWEEMDWATRMRRHSGFRIGIAPEATVYHQVGAATGSSDHGLASPSSVFWMTRSRFRFLRRHHPWLLPIAAPLLLKAVAREATARRWARAAAMARGAVASVRGV